MVVIPSVKASIAATKKIEGAIASDQENLLIKYKKEVALRKRYFNKVQELKGNIRVFVRIRKDPTLGKNDPVVKRVSENELQINNLNGSKPPSIVDFNKVYGDDTEQDEVFRDTKETITSVVDGYNVCIMAYGQTGSGKTWTMMGPEENPGVNRRAIAEVLRLLESQKDVLEYKIQASQVEVYNECVYDLLVDGPRQDARVKLRQIKNQVEIVGCTWRDIHSTEDVESVMTQGDKNRSTAATAMNTTSSRSHLIFQLKVETENKLSGSTSSGILMLVDLAGSERIEKSQVTGTGLIEAAAINKSLSTLGLVFQSLARGEPHVPFRNSALTQVLSLSLGGNSKCCMFANLSPLQSNLSETICTVRYASNATKVALGPARKGRK